MNGPWKNLLQEISNLESYQFFLLFVFGIQQAVYFELKMEIFLQFQTFLYFVNGSINDIENLPRLIIQNRVQTMQKNFQVKIFKIQEEDAF